MRTLVYSLLSTNGKSSARLVNLVVAIAIILVFIMDFIINKSINIDAMLILAAYGAGGFSISKGLDKVRGGSSVNSNIT